MTGGFTFG